jgi:hypothetical protein
MVACRWRPEVTPIQRVMLGGHLGVLIEFGQVEYCVFTIMPGGHRRTIILLALVLRSTLGYHGQVSVKLESEYKNRYDSKDEY